MDKRISQIKERIEKATPGRWKVEKIYHEEPYENYIKSAAITCNGYMVTRNDWSNPVMADLEFIAHAREDIPYLLKEIKRLQTLKTPTRYCEECGRRLDEDEEIGTEKLTPKEDLYEWILNNLKEPLRDDLYVIAKIIGKRNNWDIVEVNEMVDEMVDKVTEGILNVISTYEED